MKKSFLFLLLILSGLCGYCQKPMKISSGLYGNYLNIICSDEHVYGQFEYYEKWNSDINNFENVCILYFYGDRGNKDTIIVNVAYPTKREVALGKIVLLGNDSISFSTPYICGYGIEDFEHKGVKYKLNKNDNKSVRLGIIKEKKCKLYNEPTSNSLSRAYLIENDFVTIIKEVIDWCQIQYTSPFNTKTITKWIKSNSLYNADPLHW